LRRQTSRLRLLSLGVSFLGLTFTIDLWGVSVKALPPIGIMMGMVSGLLLGTYSLLSEANVKRVHPVPLACYTMSTGALITGFLTPPWTWTPLLMEPKVAQLAFPIAAVPCLGSLLFQIAVSLIGAGRAAIISILEPMFAVFFAYRFLGERLSWGQICGITLLLAGVCLTRLEGLPALQKKRGHPRTPSTIPSS